MGRRPMGDADARARSTASAVRGDPTPDGFTTTPSSTSATDAGTGPPLLARTFGWPDISELRHAVARCATEAGLSGPSLDDFVLAINELVTNAVRHGGGEGLLRLWRVDRKLLCEVSDRGRGITDQARTGRDRPAPSVVGGWGLWLARRLSDTMAVATGAGGTAIRITAVLPDDPVHTAPSD